MSTHTLSLMAWVVIGSLIVYVGLRLWKLIIYGK